MLLRLLSNSGTNPQTIDLTNYVRAAIEEGWDMASPAYSNRQFTTSLLKEGGTFTLENPKLKEQIIPLLITAASSTAAVAVIQQINQLLQTPGATAQWQDDGLSQATYFNLASGQCDIQFDYRKQQQHTYVVKMRLFSQPFGTTATPRIFAAASAVGPLLMISPYASSGNLTIAASTQAGVAGFGGRQQGWKPDRRAGQPRRQQEANQVVPSPPVCRPVTARAGFVFIWLHGLSGAAWRGNKSRWKRHWQGRLCRKWLAKSVHPARAWLLQ